MATLNCKGFWELEAKGRTWNVKQNDLYHSLESREQGNGKNEGIVPTRLEFLKASSFPGGKACDKGVRLGCLWEVPCGQTLQQKRRRMILTQGCLYLDERILLQPWENGQEIISAQLLKWEQKEIQPRRQLTASTFIENYVFTVFSWSSR